MGKAGLLPKAISDCLQAVFWLFRPRDIPVHVPTPQSHGSLTLHLSSRSQQSRDAAVPADAAIPGTC